MKHFVAMGLVLASFAVHGAVPFTFQAGQPAKASEVNQNFQYLDQKPGGSASVDRFTNTSESGVVSTVCPTSSTIVGVGCNCSPVNGTRNNGVLFSCNIVGNGGIAACYLESGTFEPNKPNPRGEVTIQCLSSSAGVGSNPAAKSAVNSSNRDIEEALEDARNRAASVESALRRR